MGPVGTGKTHFIAALTRELLSKDKTAGFSTVRALRRRVNATHADKSQESEEKIIRELSGVHVLALDDFGREGSVTPESIGLLHEVLSARNDNRKLTLMTTNFSLQQVAELYDPSISSRLSAWVPIVMGGADRRKLVSQPIERRSVGGIQ